MLVLMKLGALLLIIQAQLFLDIDNFEKQSGLLTLSFSVEDPNQYLDCGTILVMNDEFEQCYI